MNRKIMKSLIATMLLCTMLAYTMPIYAYTKEETVYSKIDKNGNIYNTIVSDNLKDIEQEELINDMTNLLNVENTNGEETYERNGESIIWKSNGSDIYYKGETDKELPIDCNIQYYLNNEEKTADEMVGKGGNVTVKISYTNKEKHLVNINGRKATLYTPFTVILGTILNADSNKNITVQNAKVEIKEDKAIIMGILFPGLQESLNINKKQIEIPEEVEINMETECFELNNIISYATPKIMEESNTDVFNKINDLYQSVDKIQTSSNQIEKGANNLKYGTEEYYEKSKEFNTAMNSIADGIDNVEKNYGKLNGGIENVETGSAKLNSGIEELNSGIEEINSKLSLLPDGIKQLYLGSSQLLSKIEGDKTQGKIGLETGVNEMIKTIKSLNNNLDDLLTKANKQNIASIENLEANNQKLNAAKEVLENTNNEEVIKDLEKQILINNETIKELKKANETVNGQKEVMKKEAAKNQKQLSNITEGTKQIAEAIRSINQGLEELYKKSEQLPTATSMLKKGSDSLVDGSKNLYNGTRVLRNGSIQLNSGIKTLNKGTKEVTIASGSLTSASKTIAKGSEELSNGIEQFNKEAINKICEYINRDLKPVTARMEKLQELSEDYDIFTSKDEKVKGKVKFILVNDEIKEKEE